MAARPAQKTSNGDMLKHSNGKAASKKGNKRPLKSNKNNKLKSSRDSASVSASESEDEESDSSAIEEHTTSDEDASVFALSNGRQQPVVAAKRRSAGSKSGDEDAMMIDDEMEATAGAELTTDDDDDDDQYADVEDISDSEASDGDVNERDVRRTLENDLIGEFERVEQRREANGVTNAINDMAIGDLASDMALARHLSLQDANERVDLGFEIDMNDDPFIGLPEDDSIYKAMWDEAEVALWRRPGGSSPRPSGNANSGTQKRVRFEEMHETFSRASSPASSEDANDTFPDLFASQDDPAIQRQLALDVEDDNGLRLDDFGDLESCYDFDGDEEHLAFQLDEEEDSDDSDGDSETSDSDDGGDTTDEESAEEQKARFQERRAAAARLKGSPLTPTPNRAAPRPVSSPSTSRPGTPRSGVGKGPQMGTFARDPTRALMTNDAVAKTFNVIPPTNPPEKDREWWERFQRANRKATVSRRGSCITVPSPVQTNNVPDRPFTARSTLGTMFNGNLDLLRNTGAGGDRALFLPPTLNKTTSFSATTATEDSEDDYPDINMEDFIEMSDSDSDDGRPTSSHVDSPSESEAFSSSQQMGMPSANPGLLNHFELNRNLVGSFRRNQQHTRHFSSLPSHPAQRASTHEYNALQKGRRGAANTPMTPARKKRASQDLTHISGGVRKNTNSPLASRRPRSRGNSVATTNAAGLYNTLAKSPF